MADTRHVGFHHVALNVEDVERSAAWYAEVLGMERLTAYETDAFVRVILRHPGTGTAIGLTRHNAPVSAEAFDERRAGLDHLAFRVDNAAELAAWIDRFDALGVTHSEIKPGAIPGSALVTFRDPDGLQLELFAPPSA